jgi:16S rRNA (adenine1518-N6/adenine1519-N6)-dimethyltransferase
MNKEQLLARLEEIGAEGPKRSLGQNFLVSELIVERIIKAVERNLADEIIEVGPGLGSLTDELLTLERPLTLIELDQKFVTYWSDRLQAIDSAQLIEGDALQIDWAGVFRKPTAVLVSNLPYQISSSLLIDRSLEPFSLRAMILMFQKEVAQRITATERNKEYGLLTVIAQNFWNIDLLCECSPRDYYPAPNVASRVLVFKAKREEMIPIEQRKEFLKFVKAAFAHRRKHLFNNLSGQYFSSRNRPESQLQKAFESLKLLKTARAEELSPSIFKDLFLLCQ